MNSSKALTFQAQTVQEWRDWLMEHHKTASGVWLISYKKSSAKPHVGYDEAVEEALCFGWIDSKPNKLDEERFQQFFAPRNPKSNWSRLNKQRVEKLIQEGRMTDAGFQLIELAKQNGSWNALDEVEVLSIPNDLQGLLDQHSQAKENFEAFPRSSKRNILEWIQNAKTAETRQKRVNETVGLAEQNIRANHFRQLGTGRKK
ncbi:YdeI/OmpD-associated family protein [Spirosoma arcticum]